jgi:hypothetical protein
MLFLNNITSSNSKIKGKNKNNLKLETKYLRKNSTFEGGWGDVNAV